MDDFGNEIRGELLPFDSWAQRAFFNDADLLFYVFERDQRWALRYA